jgi:predicted transposase/invertase (TIGR01784 family)
LEKETHDHDLTHLAFSFLELPKFKKKIDQLENIIDKWMYFFKHGEETTEADLAKIIGNDPIIERAYSELNRFAWSEEELLTYEQAEKYEKDYLASMEYQFDEGKAEGKLEVARELIVDGMALEKVSRVTGLGMESVKKLAADVSRKEG